MGVSLLGIALSLVYGLWRLGAGVLGDALRAPPADCKSAIPALPCNGCFMAIINCPLSITPNLPADCKSAIPALPCNGCFMAIIN